MICYQERHMEEQITITMMGRRERKYFLKNKNKNLFKNGDGYLIIYFSAGPINDRYQMKGFVNSC